jgi:hypothetical protein
VRVTVATWVMVGLTVTIRVSMSAKVTVRFKAVRVGVRVAIRVQVTERLPSTSWCNLPDFTDVFATCV